MSITQQTFVNILPSAEIKKDLIHLPFIKSQSYNTHVNIFDKLSESVFPCMFVKYAHNNMEEEPNVSSPRNTVLNPCPLSDLAVINV